MDRLTTRNDFNAVYVIGLIQGGELTHSEAVRILEEACHRIAKLESQQEEIVAWLERRPGK